MGFLAVIVLLLLGSSGVIATLRRLLRKRAARGWWFAFAGLAVVGLVAGCWLAFSFEYQVSPRTRFASFPMPLAFFRLEDGHWVDYVTPPHVMYLGLAANIIVILAVALLPLLLAPIASNRS